MREVAPMSFPDIASLIRDTQLDSRLRGNEREFGCVSQRTTPETQHGLRRGGLSVSFRKHCAALVPYPGRK
jgi:hypothetical protein